MTWWCKNCFTKWNHFLSFKVFKLEQAFKNTAIISPPLKAKIHKTLTHRELQTLIAQTPPFTWFCKKKKRGKRKRKLSTHVLRLRFEPCEQMWCADLCLSCFVPTSRRRSPAASWCRVQEATWRICPQTRGDFSSATDCLLPLHQLIRADNSPIHPIL